MLENPLKSLHIHPIGDEENRLSDSLYRLLDELPEIAVCHSTVHVFGWISWEGPS
jgi:hypothetical protein